MDSLLTDGGASINTTRGELKRFEEVDFWRGLSLLAIYLIHVPAGPWVDFQWGAWGFSDPAIVFFFLSGFVGYQANERAWQKHGWLGCWTRVSRRTGTLYCAYLVMVAAVIIIAWSAHQYLGLAQVYGSALQRMEEFSVVHPLRFAAEGAVFYAQHFCTDILPAFVVFSLLGPLANVLLRKGVMWLVVAMVGGWLIGSLIPEANPPERFHPTGWSFNPWLWQVPYLCGSLLAYAQERGMRWPRLTLFTWLVMGVYLALVILIKSPRLLPAHYSYYISLLHPTGNIKMEMSPHYLAHFFALLLVTRKILGGGRVVNWFPGAKLFQRIGRHTLWAFVGSTIAVYFVAVVVALRPEGGLVWAWMWTLVGSFSLPAVAWYCERQRPLRA